MRADETMEVVNEDVEAKLKREDVGTRSSCFEIRAVYVEVYRRQRPLTGHCR